MNYWRNKLGGLERAKPTIFDKKKKKEHGDLINVCVIVCN